MQLSTPDFLESTPSLASLSTIRETCVGTAGLSLCANWLGADCLTKTKPEILTCNLVTTLPPTAGHG